METDEAGNADEWGRRERGGTDIAFLSGIRGEAMVI